MKYLRASALVVSQYPALAIGFVAACLILLADYGLPVGGQHSLDIQSVIAAAIALLSGVVTHTQVTPASSAPTSTSAPSQPAAPPPAA